MRGADNTQNIREKRLGSMNGWVLDTDINVKYPKYMKNDRLAIMLLCGF